MAYEAKVIADSICNGQRLTTLQVTHPLVIHSEFLTHCAFARNASSSRAIPFKIMVKRVMEDPFIPPVFTKNQAGMQGFEVLEGMDRENAIRLWLNGRDKAVELASTMADVNGLNCHKQIVNRLLGPWMWITNCVTGYWGAWSNYFSLRCHDMADPSIQPQAYMSQYAYFTSMPEELELGDWHTPYVSKEDKLEIPNHYADKAAIYQISVGRCARTSYLTQEGVRDFQEDIKLHDRLCAGIPIHASPFEHVAQAMGDFNRYGKYTGWKAYRHMLKNEYVTDFKPNHPLLTSVLATV